MAAAVEVCVISFLYSISAIPCSSCSVLLLCWCFLCIYLYGILASEYLFLFFSLLSILSTFIFLIIFLCFIVVPLEAKVYFFC